MFSTKLTPAPDACDPFEGLAAARNDLFRQGQAACVLGSPFVRDVLVAVSRQLHRAPLLAMRMALWPSDRAAAALALRVNSALHALARSGEFPALSALYQTRTGDTQRVIAQTLEVADAMLAAYIERPTQTNEIARSAALYAGLMTATAQLGHPLELLELGASAGLNLNLARYAHVLGGTTVGDPASPVRIAPQWDGLSPRRTPLRVLAATGVDLTPIDAADPDACERLLSYVWADRDDRKALLQAALHLARAYPPHVERGDAADWITERLALPQRAGTARAVMHSMVCQYLPPEKNARIAAALAAAGAQADADRPLFRVSYEWDQPRSKVELVLTSWSGHGSGGEMRLLAHVDPYGDRVTWYG